MIQFNKIKLSDKTWIKPILALSNYNGCHQNFTNLFSWSDTYNYQAAKVNNFLVVKANFTKDYPYYIYPAGTGNIKEIIELMIEDSKRNKHRFTMAGLLKENKEQLSSIFPGRFSYNANRDIFDYVYSVEKLSELSGNKLHSKRNHINYFKKHFNWSFELLSSVNLFECWEMTIQWCIKNGCESDHELSDEFLSVRTCFDNFEELQLEGGLLRKDGKVIAYTMGEKLNSDTYVIHIEKAFGDIRGAYQMINQQFAQVIKKHHPEISYINREEDMGYEGLRKSKLSYFPDILVEKYYAELIDI